MRWIAGLIVFATLGASGAALAASDSVFAIPNPQRPGAKAADCTTLPETLDGCTFHTAKDDVNHARLPAGEGVNWEVTGSEPGAMDIRRLADETGADGAPVQVFALTPTTPKDADLVVTFDRLQAASDGGAPHLVERRRASVMVHGLAE